MIKYPVTSDYGINYEVQIELDEGYFGETEVYVYEHYTGVFGKSRKKRVSKGSYIPEIWEYDFIAMAQNQVRKYETGIADELRRKWQRADGIEAFAKWDGK